MDGLVSPVVLFVLVALVAIPVGIALLIYMVVPVAKAIGWVFSQVFRFIFGELGDVLRIVGGVLTGLVMFPMTIASVIFGRWSAASHYGRAIQSELKSIGGCLYRIVIGHPARLFCLTALTEGLERRVPHVVAAAPGADRSSGRAGQFDGYSIVGSLAGGGSGGRLYIATPTPERRASLERAGHGEVSRVVIKSFSLRDGSSLPQIVRENRALPAAKRLGLILEHDLTEERFHYVMKYVPGESLGLVTQRLHSECGAGGLDEKRLRETVEYASDLVRTLCHYHAGGLWHKDVKPDNIIVADGQAHLVDFGLITPLRSSLTLTTHGTEYFRDPEMVRMALRGVKVHEVDGAKFDIYAAGAVLYSMIENSFPAHGGLSQITQRCPESLRWIVRRAMTDYDKRYDTAAAMLADLEAVAVATDPFSLKPSALPSFGAEDDTARTSGHEWEAAVPVAFRSAGSAIPPVAAVPAVDRAVRPAVPDAPTVKVTNWWTGRYAVRSSSPAQVPPARIPRVQGATAAEQLSRARRRARDAQERAHRRMNRYAPEAFRPLNFGVGVAVVAFLLFIGGVVFVLGMFGVNREVSVTEHRRDGQDRTVRIGADGIRVSPLVQSPSLEREDPPVAVRTREIETPDGGRIIVLKDPVAVDSAFRGDVDRQLEQLRGAGFSLCGDVNSETAGRDADSTDVELAAGLRSDLGLRSFGGGEAAETIRKWLDQHQNVHMAIWIGRADGPEPETWVLARRGLDARLVDKAAEALRVSPQSARRQ